MHVLLKIYIPHVSITGTYSSKYLNAIFQTYNANTLPPPLINPDAWGQTYPE